MLRRLLLAAAVVVLVGAAAGGAAIWWTLRAIAAPGPLAADTVAIIAPGTGLRAIARQLAGQQIVAQDWLLLAAALHSGADRALQAGEYRFQAGISPLGIVALLQSGAVVLHPVTVPEGLTVAQIAALLEAVAVLDGPVGALPPEGSLLPETYAVPRGTARAALIAQMRTAMTATLDRLWAGRASGSILDTPAEALTLASIVEKETGIAAERARVAGVFINRLQRGMPLQADPTVVYALTGGSGKLDRPLTRADWQVDSPYNTYRNAGLPPGPIANPGAASLAAVLAPEAHALLYFVADGSGGHVFAATLAEHNRNVARWRRVRDAAAEPVLEPVE